MRTYEVVITATAQEDIYRCINYLVNVKKSIQAAQSVFEDYVETRQVLSNVADSLKQPGSSILSSLLNSFHVLICFSS